MSNSFLLTTILIISGVTSLLRFAPFIIFSGRKKLPAFVTYLGESLPYAIMAMLVVYCLRVTDFSSSKTILVEAVAVAFVIIIHLWRKNTLVTVFLGTVFYMVCKQFLL